jgi:hypothetical protein
MCAVLLELSAAAAIAEFGNSRCVREYMKKFSLINFLLLLNFFDRRKFPFPKSGSAEQSL